jgi:ribosome biogenesis GTPase
MTDFALSSLGWTRDVEAAFLEHRAAGLVPGRVALEHNHVYRVFTTEGEWLAEAAGRIKYLAEGRHELPAVGDWVALRPPSSGGRAVIKVILPRRSKFSRKVAGRETEEQVVAANIDTVFIVSSIETVAKLRSIERYLVLVRQSGAQPVVILNKSDRSEDVAAAVTEVTLLAPDVPVHAVSALTGAGFEAVNDHLQPGRTVALLGPSGSGKSSIVNRLVGVELLATGEVRPWDSRGRHTSVHRQLVVLPSGGIVIDTPGMRELQLWDADEGVDQTFTDVSALAASCRFRDCRHDREPGCAVKAAVASGDLDADRYESYSKIAREQEAFELRQEERGQIEAKRLGKVGAKAYRALEKKRGH